MTDEQKALLALTAGDTKAIRIGDEVLYPPAMVGAKAFQFNAYQNGFLYWFQQYNGDMELACKKIGKSTDWAKQFFLTRKFREFRNAKLAIASISQGALLEEWKELGVAGMRGYREWYEGACALCHEENVYSATEIETYREDNMTLAPTCKACFQEIKVELKREDFKPSREQVQFWAELGNRVSPKIERIQHEFSSETFTFQSSDGEAV